MISESERVLARLANLHPAKIDLGLERVFGLLKKLGEPQKKLPPVVHVAGTNGKGSTIAFLKAFLEADGKRVHTYTSPHLARFNERIVLNGREISENDLTRFLTLVERANDGAPVTFFESVTAAAFLAFSETPADVVLLETGMGGRLDATNVVEEPACCVIASLSMDHENYLGHTLAAIAGEKAGIFKKNRPVVAASSPQEALDVLIEKAARLSCPLKIQGRDWTLQEAENGFSLDGAYFDAPALPGKHQYQNAALAIAALKELAAQGVCRADDAIVRQGLKTVRWAGRLEKMDFPEGRLKGELWLDGGHNPGAAEVLSRFLPAWKDKPLHLVCGMLTTKDARAYLEKVAPFAQTFDAVAFEGETAPCFSPDALADFAKPYVCGRTGTAQNVFDALEMLRKNGEDDGRVLICGSLYLIGGFLRDVNALRGGI